MFYNFSVVNIVSTFFAVLALLSISFVAIAIVSFISEKLIKCRCYSKFKKIVHPIAYPFAFIVALVATLGSLFYSEVAHFVPCKLCWYQRILMYPQTILLYTAIIRKEKVLTPYLLVINALGFLIGSYHYLIQKLPSYALLPCGLADSCTRQYIGHFGFITIPFMSAAAFLLLFTLLTLSRKTK